MAKNSAAHPFRVASIPSQTEEAYRAIKRMVIQLELPPGSQFTEAELAALSGTSKTPVREALVRLQQEGLVEAIPRSGYRVSPVTLKGTRELFELRTLVLCEAAERAATRGIPSVDVDRLEALLAVKYDQLDANSIDVYLGAIREFDATIARGSGNDRLVAVLMQFFDELGRVLRSGLAHRPWSPEAAAQRRDVVEALRARDGAQARAAMRVRCLASQASTLNALLESSSIGTASIQLPAAAHRAGTQRRRGRRSRAVPA